VKNRKFIRISSFLLACLSSVLGIAEYPRSKDAPAVAIDVGHSMQHPGARSASGVPEFEFNRAVADLLLKELRRSGFSGAFILESEKEDLNLRQRVDKARGQHAALLVSIHHDSVQPQYLKTWRVAGRDQVYCDQFKGYSLFCSGSNKAFGESVRCARAIGQQLRQAGFAPSLHHSLPVPGENRTLIDSRLGIYEYSELGILRGADCPAVLIECGVILNREEEKNISSIAVRRKLVHAIASGIIAWWQPRTEK